METCSPCSMISWCSKCHFESLQSSQPFRLTSFTVPSPFPCTTSGWLSGNMESWGRDKIRRLSRVTASPTSRDNEDSRTWYWVLLLEQWDGRVLPIITDFTTVCASIHRAQMASFRTNNMDVQFFWTLKINSLEHVPPTAKILPHLSSAQQDHENIRKLRIAI